MTGEYMVRVFTEDAIASELRYDNIEPALSDTPVVVSKLMADGIKVECAVLCDYVRWGWRPIAVFHKGAWDWLIDREEI